MPRSRITLRKRLLSCSGPSTNNTSFGGISIAASVLVITSWAALGGAASATTGLLAARRGEKYPRWQTVVQLSVTIVLFAVFAGRYGLRAEVLGPSALAVTTVPLAVLDARTRRLPNWLVLASYVLVGSAATTSALLTHSPPIMTRTLIGALILLVFCGTLYVLFPGQLGGGDVKLAGPLGAVLGWSAWSAIFPGLLLGWTLAAFAQLVLRILRRGQACVPLPLGTFLIIGTFITLLLLTG